MAFSLPIGQGSFSRLPILLGRQELSSFGQGSQKGLTLIPAALFLFPAFARETFITGPRGRTRTRAVPLTSGDAHPVVSQAYLHVAPDSKLGLEDSLDNIELLTIDRLFVCIIHFWEVRARGRDEEMHTACAWILATVVAVRPRGLCSISGSQNTGAVVNQ